MSEGPGLTRLYKDGDSCDVEDEKIEGLLASGWKDEPQLRLPVSGPKTSNIPYAAAPARPVFPDARSVHDQIRMPDPTPAPKIKRGRGRPKGS